MFFCIFFINIYIAECGFVHFVQGSVQRNTCVLQLVHTIVHIFHFILHTHTQDVIMDLKYIPSIRVYTTFSYIYMNIYVIPFKLFNEKNIYIF